MIRQQISMYINTFINSFYLSRTREKSLKQTIFLILTLNQRTSCSVQTGTSTADHTEKQHQILSVDRIRPYANFQFQCFKKPTRRFDVADVTKSGKNFLFEKLMRLLSSASKTKRARAHKYTSLTGGYEVIPSSRENIRLLKSSSGS